MAAMAACGLVLFLALLMSVLVSAFRDTNTLASISWFAFSLLPLAVVIALATLVRLQQRINLKSGYGAFHRGKRTEKVSR